MEAGVAEVVTKHAATKGWARNLAATLSLSASSSSTSSSPVSFSTTSYQISTITNAPSQTQTISPISTPTDTSNNKSSSKVPIAVGLGVGIPAFVIVAGLMAFFLIRKWKQMNIYQVNGALTSGEKKTELPVDNRRHEVRGDETAHEVHGDYGKPVHYEVDGITRPIELSTERYQNQQSCTDD
jgi:hypothetical protein